MITLRGSELAGLLLGTSLISLAAGLYYGRKLSRGGLFVEIEPKSDEPLTAEEDVKTTVASTKVNVDSDIFGGPLDQKEYEEYNNPKDKKVATPREILDSIDFSQPLSPYSKAPKKHDEIDEYARKSAEEFFDSIENWGDFKAELQAEVREEMEAEAWGLDYPDDLPQEAHVIGDNVYNFNEWEWAQEEWFLWVENDNLITDWLGKPIKDADELLGDIPDRLANDDFGGSVYIRIPKIHRDVELCISFTDWEDSHYRKNCRGQERAAQLRNS